MGKAGPETRLLNAMRKAGQAKYGDRLVIVKQHGGPYATAGVSDLLCCVFGVFVAVEVKSPDTSHGVTVKQAAFLETVDKAGGLSGVCYSVEEFLSLLEQAAELALMM